MSVSEPGKIITPWAESGLKNPIPPAANPATGRAGFDQGFSAINMTAKEAGGIPPFGQDFNGIFYEVTNILRYMQAGGQPTFDAALATAIGGYPKGAMVLGSDGVSVYTNIVDSNSSNPNSGGSGWARGDLMLREALRRSYAEAGYPLIGDFSDTGLVVTTVTDVVLWEPTGIAYAYSGTLPHTISAMETPIGNPLWVDKSLLLPGAGVVRDGRFALRDYVSVMDFGPVGDGVADDTVAVLKAIKYVKGTGKELDWHDRTYRVTSTLDITFSSVMRWVSSGAKIFYDPPAGTYSALRLRLITGGNYIKGNFTVDANQRAHVGLRGHPTVNITEEPDLLLEDTEVINVYRASTAFPDGDGMLFDGSFGRIHLVRPKVKDCHMAVGAGIHGTYGIFGISCIRAAPSSQNNCAKYVVIEDPSIENIWSDDSTYMNDQDGIRVFTRYGGSATGGKNNPNTFDFRGGRIINVRGRSIKGQTEAGRISGVKLYRTTLANAGNPFVWTLNADIEMQTGGCTVSDIEFQYEGFAHARPVRLIQADDTVPYASPNVIDGIRGVVTGITELESIVFLSGNDGATSTDMSTTISNLNVESEGVVFQRAVSLGSSHAATRIFVAANNIIGKFSSSVFSSSGIAVSTDMLASNIVNRGPEVPLYIGLMNSIARLTALNLYGVTGYPTINFGFGSPECVLVAPIGSTFHRMNGGEGTSLYVKESGVGNTGWVAK